MIKSGTILYGIKPEMVLCHSIIYDIFIQNGFGCVITSAVGRKHSDGSLHPPGYALDFRTKHINSNSIKKQITEDIKKALPCCDVILEDLDGDQEHIHAEFDPKNDPDFQRDKKIYKETGEWPRQL